MGVDSQLETLLRDVLMSGVDILTPLQIKLAEEFITSNGSMHLVKRIIFKLINYRKREYNRLITLVEEQDINELEQAQRLLELSSFCSCSGPPETDHLAWLNLLKLYELKQLALPIKGLHQKANVCTLRKKVIDHYLGQRTLENFFKATDSKLNTRRLVKACKAIIGTLVCLKSDVREEMYQIFVIHYKCRYWPIDGVFMRNTILANMTESKLSFFEYKIWTRDTIWKTRDAFTAYYQCIKEEHTARLMYMEKTPEGYTQCVLIAKRYQDLLKEDLGTESKLDVTYSWLAPYTCVHVILRTLDLCSRALFKLKRYNEQAEILSKLLNQKNYHISKRGRWYTELAKTYHRYIDPSKAIDTCIEALSDLLVDSESLVSIKKRLQKLGKIQTFQSNKILSPSITIMRKRVYSKRSEKALWLSKSGKIGTVEEIALEYFTARHGWKGIHSETCIITTIFGLLFWDIIFDDTAPGVFWSAFQDSPLDLKTHFFYEARRDKIHQRLSDIADGKFSDILTDVFSRESERKTVCIGVNWDLYPIELLLEISKCIGGTSLSLMSAMLCKEYYLFQSGAPDLCIWNPDDGKILFVEVKGENDVISDRQHLWIGKLLSINVGVAVAHIRCRSSPSKKKRKISRK